MSADIFIEDPGCCWDHWVNVTHNLGPMFREAGVDWRTYLGGPDYNERDGANSNRLRNECTRALRVMREEPDRFKAMNPPNGWGDYAGAVNILEQLLVFCERHPNATVRVSL